MGKQTMCATHNNSASRYVTRIQIGVLRLAGDTIYGFTAAITTQAH